MYFAKTIFLWQTYNRLHVVFKINIRFYYPQPTLIPIKMIKGNGLHWISWTRKKLIQTQVNFKCNPMTSTPKCSLYVIYMDSNKTKKGFYDKRTVYFIFPILWSTWIIFNEAVNTAFRRILTNQYRAMIRYFMDKSTGSRMLMWVLFHESSYDYCIK